MKIAFFTSEAVPFAKTGGLADVAGALPQALSGLGHEVIVVMPAYKELLDAGWKMKACKAAKDVTMIKQGDVAFYFLHNSRYFLRDDLYGDRYGDYTDNLDRFAFFCRRGLHLLEELDFQADIAHCHDWQSALIPVYLKSLFSGKPFFQRVSSVLTLHNIGYQGIFPKSDFNATGLIQDMFSLQGLEFYGQVNLLKGGVIFADALTTVSPTYSREIQSGEFGCGLDGVLRQRRERLSGILNGLDYAIWNPLNDKNISVNYDERSLAERAANKKELQKLCGLAQRKDASLLAVVSRLAEQKGIDLIVSVLEELFEEGMQAVILGTGDPLYHRLLQALAVKYPASISLNLKFDEALAHKIYAGSDIFLMPSRYEPCGLSQMIALRYGSVPVVFKTGGLADTVSESDGFLFDDFSADKFKLSIRKAAALSLQKEKWSRMIESGMSRRFSWESSAAEYVSVYEKAVAAK